MSASATELQFDNRETADWKQAHWRRMLPVFAAISYGGAAAVFFMVYFSSGFPPPADIVDAAILVAGFVAGILSLALYSVGRMKAVSTIAVDDAGITLTTIAGLRQVMRWDDPRFRLRLWNRGPSLKSLPINEEAGVLNAPRAFVGWPTRMARESLLRVAREHGVQAWTWHPWSLYTVFPTSTLLARKLSITDRLRGLRTARPDS